MVWIPAANPAACANYPNLMSCQASVLTFFAFLSQNFNHSLDENFSDSGKVAYNDEKFDFVIVGGGTAGCVLANRLSEVENWKVLLLEAGGEEPLVTNVPAFTNYLWGSSIDWKYRTAPEPVACKQSPKKTCPLTRGKVLGGSSSMNGMGHVRGNRHDFDNWSRLGNVGWSYEEVLPYFKKSEDVRMREVLAMNASAYGTGGYLTIDSFPYKNKYADVMIDAWKDLGYDQTDYNSHNSRLGVAYAQFTTVHGARQSANGAFLRPIRGRRPNLTIETDAIVKKVIVDDKTKQAIGVEYTSLKDQPTKRVYVDKEVIVSAGVFDSPKILMLSGIGPAEELRQAKIDLIKDLPVGENLQDHPTVTTFPFSLNGNFVNNKGSDIMNDVVYWMNTHEGPLSIAGPGIEVYLQTKFENRTGVPDVQLLYNNVLYEDIENYPDDYRKVQLYPRSYSSGLSTMIALINPKSRGTVKLNKVDPVNKPPLIQMNYFTESEDLETLLAGVSMAKRIFNTETFKKYGFECNKRPRKLCKQFDVDSRDYLRCLIETTTGSYGHGVGTCKMGPASDPTAVVDPRLKVHGVKGLRVIDASVMPLITRGAVNGPIVMITEKGSDMIKEYWL